MDLSFPIIFDPDQSAQDKADALFSLNEGGDAGFYPVGANNFWHGGVHFATDEPLRSVGEGEVIAYRINEMPLECEIAAMQNLDHVEQGGFSLVTPESLAKLRDLAFFDFPPSGRVTHYSNGFVLVRHKYLTPRGTEIVFYALYMHLLPLGFYSSAQATLERAPSIFHASRHIVIEKSDGAGLAIYDAANPATKVGVIPHDMIFTMDIDEHPPDAWSKKRPGKDYRSVTFGGVSGFANAAKASNIAGDQYRQTVSSSDQPLDADSMGLNVRESADAHSVVLRVVPHGSRVRFVKEPPEKGKYNELTEGGFILYADKTVKTDKIVEPEKYDQVVVPSPPKKIAKGDIVGYAGPYITVPNVCHFEIFLDNLDFTSNPNKDDWGPATYIIPSNLVLASKEPLANPDIKVDFKAGDAVNVLETDSLSDFKKVSGRALTGATAEGWIAPASAGTNQGSHHFKLTAPVASLTADDGSAVPINAQKGDILTQDPAKKKTGFIWVSYPLREIREGWTDTAISAKSDHFAVSADVATLKTINPRTAFKLTGGAGQTGSEIIIREPAPLPKDYYYIHSDGTKWLKVAFSSAAGPSVGYVRTDNPNIKVHSDYDWFQWRKFEDPDKYSSDGFCDVPALFMLLRDQTQAPLTSRQIKDALADVAAAKILRNSFTIHPTEWDSVLDDVIGKWDRLAYAPWNMPQSLFEDTQKHIDKLQFWSSVPGLPDPGKLAHAHPIGFLLHLKELMGVTAAQIKVILAPKVRDADISKYVVHINTAMRTGLITTRLRQSHFFGQIGVESDSLRAVIEYDSGEGYNGKLALANVEPGDGPRFRGRGLIQVTGRANSTFYMHDRLGRFFTLPAGAGTESERLKQLVESDEFQRISDEPELACDSAAWYWNECTNFFIDNHQTVSVYSFTKDDGSHYTLVRTSLKDCNTPADGGATDAAVQAVLSRIGGDPTSLPQRQAFFRAARRVLMQ